jgi:hypothetical protein
MKRLVDMYRAEFEGLLSPRPDVEAFLLESWKNCIEPTSSPVERFTLAVGLLAFGHLEVLGEVLDELPDDTRIGRYIGIVEFGRIVADLIPIPRDLDPRKRTDHPRIKEWIRDQTDRLRWNEDAGVFELVDE